MNNMRFYPESMPPFAYEPTSSTFEIRDLPAGVGQGLIALRDFEVGEVVFAFTGFFTSEITLFTLQVRPGLYLHDPFVMGKVLHCCDPNMYCDMEKRMFTAIKPIKAGECVTMDYEQTEDQLYRAFHCECGAESCRGYIAGRLMHPMAREAS